MASKIIMEDSRKSTKPLPWADKFCDYIERGILWFFDDYNSKKTNYWIKNNYAPADEHDPATNLHVVGTIPECMNGEFLRVGPNPKFQPVASYHWFDGDGMIHGLKIKDGNATYVSRYVKTSRLQQEEKYGAAKFLKMGDLRGPKGMLYIRLHKLRARLGVIDLSRGAGTGNTALIYHNKKLLALNEGDKPYAMRVLEDGDLETLGRVDYGGKLQHPFTAHPKVDPITGEMFTFGYEIDKSPPQITYRVISKDGIMQDPVCIHLPQIVMMHDFAITENYAIFMDLPLLMDGESMMKGNFFIKFDETKEARLGVLPRYATNESQLRWFTIPVCFIFHNANAWEEGDEIVLHSCRMEEINLTTAADGFKENERISQPKLFEFRINLKTGEVRQKQLSVLVVDFPRVNEEYMGRKTQYMYGAIMDKESKMVGVGKFDLLKEPEVNPKSLEEGGDIEGVFLYGPGRFGGEAIFVPRNPGRDGPEDDGYLIVFVHDEIKDKSEVVIIDAKAMAADPVAVVSMPTRVPYGFHAFFVTEEQLKNQS
ncbi:carotenoid 9,10(9',10')-cleavage dioxygenase isoform X1 [Physcomitrium patens]|uniref:carotenoid 9,10-dioxygenase n=2 Tax=Physcomitrium patens TaxID=3218 RepID=A9RJA4_PHYPA|nr:carotenoid 9,10(9',10')-cleavage dioxygenase-like isoform X1 [Physcomitrium patens]XP_024360876.1 carotenoid 9,10(9',10')-cleavage dioxygenase-like isoform X1 [Physcomitrium patens]XP_024360877.1 carotenoid 9,10(9',10')-cleavage dioxygenase-like isoform X1 [Physcomitrium patens]XP_024360878.1 carotenoid 9,10(9',10')-cleavage dioxygenase-like isoform X1 [Physcomitrium patens]XP_024360879.1 carotenoid 9,10(9',10')-cleavage dioxygenase-like isoform X1 [Physcomitrium patens]XP_024360880.1 carot|eukprot:XP_024360875.1 carotenoid 9,10(9',10')-cleavage dioxygenase-like isoform X1 [Physcomitrella patens]